MTEMTLQEAQEVVDSLRTIIGQQAAEIKSLRRDLKTVWWDVIGDLIKKLEEMRE